MPMYPYIHIVVKYDKITKIIGILCTVGLTFYGYKLQKKMNSKTHDYFFSED